MALHVNRIIMFTFAFSALFRCCTIWFSTTFVVDTEPFLALSGCLVRAAKGALAEGHRSLLALKGTTGKFEN